jgi:uncharacterized protein (DUF2235 family)
MAKSIVVCCDGTRNKVGLHKSNVVRLFATLAKTDAAGRPQVAYYHPGIGTMPARAALTPVARYVTKLAGSAVGYGLFDDVTDLYSYLVATYEDRDTVHLVGFSRGAFTVRILAGLLHRCGLLRPECTHLIPYAYELYRPHVPDTPVIEEFRGLFSRPCPVHFMGLWDTVKAYGALWPISLPHLRVNPSVAHVRHALALDERRTMFTATTWVGVDSDSKQMPPGQTVKEVWFAGCHADVGGGSAEKQGSLYKPSLRWMAEEAQACGVGIDAARLARFLDEPAGTPEPIESLSGFWHLAELMPRMQLVNHDQISRRRPTIGLWRGRQLADSTRGGHLTVHTSVPDAKLTALAKPTTWRKPVRCVREAVERQPADRVGATEALRAD